MRGQILILCSFSLSACLGQLRSIPVTGVDLPPKSVVISIDDAPSEPWQSAIDEPPSWTDAIADYLITVPRTDENGNITIGVPVVWFPVSCHFDTEPPPLLPPPASVMCLGARDQNVSLLERLAARGFVVGNHTHSHVPASVFADPKVVPAAIRDSLFVEDSCIAQRLFGRFQRDHWHLFRAPGLDWPVWAAPVLNASECLDRLDGPIDVDVGGRFVLDDGTVMGGDWDCPNRGLTPEACGDLYLRDIRSVTPVHGAIVLLHNYVIPGEYSLRVIQRIIEHLDADVRVVDIRTHPAFRERHPLFLHPR
jgi:peptidoglycan/xylan/chitin deacetylase (PgdA/CDA1 family)